MKHHKLGINSWKNYHRLTLADREEISRGLANQETLTSIAQRIDKDKSALSCEVNRNGMTKDTCRAHKAHWNSQRQREKQGRKNKIAENAELQTLIYAKLKLRWLPRHVSSNLTILPKRGLVR